MTGRFGARVGARGKVDAVAPRVGTSNESDTGGGIVVGVEGFADRGCAVRVHGGVDRVRSIQSVLPFSPKNGKLVHRKNRDCRALVLNRGLRLQFGGR